MKKIAKKLTIIPVLIICAGTFMGCISGGRVVGPVEWTVDKIGEGIEAGISAGVGAIKDAARDARIKKEFAAQRSANPLDSPVEGRLTRRTSTLAGGIPVDISPYLLQDFSIAVTENGIRRSGSLIKISGLEGALWEYDVALTFKADKQSYQMNVTATACDEKIKEQMKQSMKQFAAGRLGLEPKKIQNFQVKLLKTRRGKSDYRFDFDNVFVQETEGCYFQFDVEAEYQKQEVKKGKKEKNQKTQPEDFAVFDQTYYSDLMSEAGAAIEMQAVIWNAAREASGVNDETPLPVINVVKAVKIPETAEARGKRIAKQKTDLFSKGGESPFNKGGESSSTKDGGSPFTNAAEERLTRRTSTLAGGIPVDVSPCLLHGNSFAVTEKGIQHYRSILESVTASGGNTLYEFDVALAFEADSQKCQMSATVAACGSKESETKKRVKEYMLQYAARRMSFDPKTIKNFKIKYLKTRKGKTTLDFRFDNVFVHTIEPGYFQFDAEVEYQKWKNAYTGASTQITPDSFTVFNQIYRSNFTTVEAAAIDAQMAIWNDARKKGFNATPLPVINFIKVVKVKQ